MHYALTRTEAQKAKIRLYSVLEAINGTAPLRRRRAGYAANIDYAAGGEVTPVDPAWFCGWERAGIDMRSITVEPYYWQDFEVLRLFAQHGLRRFRMDDIWNIDWEACRQAGLRAGLTGLPDRPILPPGPLAGMAGRLVDASYQAAVWARSRVWR
jgi:hypothetical protein